ncbi:MAG: cyclic nucleotide-binding domain-containing protein [Pirellulaceae bacterium]|nr:cyclic nucleotide-binding domain-containing protein [Pirellulaceae bacterium]
MSESDESIELLRRMPVFGGLSESSLQFILDKSESVDVEPDDYFFHEGEPAQSLYVLTAGSVTIEKTWNGEAVHLGELGVGDCVGEMAIIDLEPRSAAVRANTACRAIKVTRHTLLKLYQSDLEQYALIMMNMGREVSRRLRVASEQLFERDQTMPK